MSTLLFVEILRERDVQAQWFDVRKVMRTNDRFGRAEPDVAALAELAALQLLPRLNEGLVITRGDLSVAKIKVVQRRLAVEAAIIRQPCWRRLYTHLVLISGPTSRASTPPIHAWFPQQNALMKSRLPKRQRWQLLVQKYCIRQRCYPQYVAISRSLSAPAKTHAQVVRWCAIKTENPPLFRALALRRNQTLLTLHSLNMLHSRGFLAEVFGILARHNISVDLITTSEVSVALTLDTTGSTSTDDTLLTQSLLMELSALCRVEVEEGLALVALIGNDLSKSLRRWQRGIRRTGTVQHSHDLLRRIQP